MLSLNLLGISKKLQNLPSLALSFDVPIETSGSSCQTFSEAHTKSSKFSVKLFSIILNNNYYYYSKIKGKTYKQQNNHNPAFFGSIIHILMNFFNLQVIYILVFIITCTPFYILFYPLQITSYTFFQAVSLLSLKIWKTLHKLSFVYPFPHYWYLSLNSHSIYKLLNQSEWLFLTTPKPCNITNPF